MREINNRLYGLASAVAALWLLTAWPLAAQSSLDAGSSEGEGETAPGPSQEDSAVLGSLVNFRVAGSALRPRETNVTTAVDGGGGCAYVGGGNASTVWNTPVYLPQGATVDTLRMYYYDTSASNTTAWFTVYDLYGAIVQEWPVTSSGSAGNGLADSVQINHTIDYNVNSYMINWRPLVAGSTLQLCGFRIFYTQ
ncbi:MAG: hypothetical protein K8J08_06265 [Thermoanaerobaculia bacterium]|nr:hypothetical protein [Thermoanaerobaculia bacterium]